MENVILTTIRTTKSFNIMKKVEEQFMNEYIQTFNNTEELCMFETHVCESYPGI